MKAVIVLVVALASFGASAAIESTGLTCQQIRDSIRSSGQEVVQTYGQPATNKAPSIYSDFGAQLDCTGDHQRETAWVLDKDGQQCPAGNVCVKPGHHAFVTNLNYSSWR